MRARWALFLLVTTSFSGFGATRRALLIGIEQYNPPGSEDYTAPAPKSASRKGLVSGDVRHWRYENLRGPVNDVNLIEGILLSKDFGFQPDDIVKLIKPEETTAEAILKALRHELVETAGEGDIRFVYYSGHGNFIRNRAIERKNPSAPNQYDQTIVASDHWKGAVDVRDKELAKILWEAAQKKVTVTFIADSCHSGSLTRGPGNSRGKSRSNSGVRTGVNGAAFPEPVIDDPPPVDPKTHEDMNPEAEGVLTLAAAQENQEALEIKDNREGIHGVMTLALVRAIREEGPHASMKRIFERMVNYMQAKNLAQTPVLGGDGRGEKDLLGQVAQQGPFSVLVKKVVDGEALLGAGDAIGLYEGSELRPVDGGDATLVVVKSLGLTESAAKISPAGAKVSAGDRLEVANWAVPKGRVLRVYIPEPAPAEVISQAATLASLRQDPAVHWVEDPAADSPNAILRWSEGRWKLDRIARDARSQDLGAAPSAAEVKKALTAGAKLFVRMPPDAALAAAVKVGEGTEYTGIERLSTADEPHADYRLFGRLSAAGVQYAWVLADADLGSRLVSRSGKPAAAQPPLSSLPRSTDWFNGSADQVGKSLTEYAVRLGRLRGWLNLGGYPGKTEFPYDLVLRKTGTAVNAKPGVLTGGDSYDLLLQLDPAYRDGTVLRRWVYVFVIDQKGKGTPLYPFSYSGSEGNYLPRNENGKVKTAPATKLIRLRERPFKISEPYGTDTYIMISASSPLDPGVFKFDGVQSEGVSRGTGNELQDLLAGCGDATRGEITSRAPGEWSIQRLTFQSKPSTAAPKSKAVPNP